MGTQLLASKKGADWSDYVFLNGRLLLTADSFEDRILIQGTNSCSNCGQYSLFTFPNAGGYAGYVIRSGDKLFLRQWQSTGARGGMQITFTDGSNTNWNTYDQDGKQLNNDDAVSNWHYRRADLSAHAGKAISNIRLVSESTTAAGAWSIYFNDIALVSTDGTVRPLYNRNGSISLTASGSAGVTGRASSVNHLSNVLTSADTTTTYLHSDHLGSGRMTSSVNGYPTWQAIYLPFGDEYTNQLGINSFKFGTYNHDDESDLDYAKFRYYSSQFGRFMSPDLLAGDVSNPQSLNRYAYALNNPLNIVDPLGLTCYTVTRTGTAADGTAIFTMVPTDCPPPPDERNGPNDAIHYGNGGGPQGGCSVPMGLTAISLGACPGGGGRGGRGREHVPNQPEAANNGTSFLSRLNTCVVNNANNYSIGGVANLLANTEIPGSGLASNTITDTYVFLTGQDGLLSSMWDAAKAGFTWAAAASPPVMTNGPNSFTTIRPARGSPQPILGKGTNYRGFWASAKRLVKSGAQLKLAIDAGLTGALVLNCSLGQIQ